MPREWPTISMPLNHTSPVPLAAPKGGGSKGRDGEKLKKACADFESIFISQMLKEMRRTVPKSGLLDGGGQQNMYLSLLDDDDL